MSKGFQEYVELIGEFLSCFILAEYEKDGLPMDKVAVYFEQHLRFFCQLRMSRNKGLVHQRGLRWERPGFDLNRIILAMKAMVVVFTTR